MKKYHPILAIIIGAFLIALMISFLPDLRISYVFIAIALILGGFVATYLSRTNKAIIGLYTGLLFSVGGYLPVMLIFRFVSYVMIIMMIISPILGFLGGFIAKYLRTPSDKKNLENQ